MPIRKTYLANGEYYHVFNRGVARLPIFNNKRDYRRFINTFLYYQHAKPKPRLSLFKPELIDIISNNKHMVDIVGYCLMPNHFHFLLKQNMENGISKFMADLSNSYSKYFNIKYKRIGPLLQGAFKALHIESNEQLLHLSRYIHLNPVASFISKKIEDYEWSSYLEYINVRGNEVCKKDIVLLQMKNVADYQKFILDQADYAKQLEKIKNQLIDYE